MSAPAAILDRFIQRPAQVEVLYGTIWNGTATLAGGHRAEWRFAGLRSIKAFEPRFDVEVSGPSTRLTARAGLTPDRLTLFDVTGRAGWSLISSLAPKIPISCTPLAAVDLNRVVLSKILVGAEGVLRSNAGDCVNRDLPNIAPVPVPPLTARMTMDDRGTRAVLAATDDAGIPLAEASLTGVKMLAITVHPEGARMVPGMPSSAPMMLEMEL